MHACRAGRTTAAVRLRSLAGMAACHVLSAGGWLLHFPRQSLCPPTTLRSLACVPTFQPCLKLQADYDGSATQRPTPSIVGSWPDWWNLDAGCTYEVRLRCLSAAAACCL